MSQDARITLHPSRQRMQVHANGMLLLVDSINTIELRELGYPLANSFGEVILGKRLHSAK